MSAQPEWDTEQFYRQQEEAERTPEPTPANNIPEFEGNKVHRTKAQFTSANNLEVEDEVYRLDQIKRFYVEARVVNVHHRVSEKSHELERVQVLKVVDVKPVSWDVAETWKD